MGSWKDEYPFQSNYFETSHGRLHYVDEGPRDSKKTIVCVHGNPTWSFYYRSIIQEFRGETRSIAVDHLGCGLSDKPQGYDYCLANHTKNLVDLIDSLDLKNIVLVVHDWGGAIGLGAAVARSPKIAQMLILNTGAFPPPYIPYRISVLKTPLLGSAAIRYCNAFAWPATWMAIDRLPTLSSAARDGLLYPYRSYHDRVAINGFVQDIPLSSKHKTWTVLESLEQNLPTLSQKPTTIVWGMKDWCFTAAQCMTRIKQLLPQSKTRELSDVGHYVMEEASSEVNEELRLLVQDNR